MKLLKLHDKLVHWPLGEFLGRRLFSLIVSLYAPYFYSIRPRVLELSSHNVKIALKKRWAVQNHIGTVHAIAICNLCEMCAGLLMEAGLPSHQRWIPKSMNVSYLAKAGSDLIGVCESKELATAANGDFVLKVQVFDKNQKIVVSADITMWVSERQKSG